MGAAVVTAFDTGRKRNPALYSNRLVNKALYTWDGIKDSVVRSCKNLNERIQVEVRRLGRTHQRKKILLGSRLRVGTGGGRDGRWTVLC